MVPDSLLIIALDAFMRDPDTTLTPAAFLLWVHENYPHVAQMVGDGEILALAASYSRRRSVKQRNAA